MMRRVVFVWMIILFVLSFCCRVYPNITVCMYPRGPLIEQDNFKRVEPVQL